MGGGIAGLDPPPAQGANRTYGGTWLDAVHRERAAPQEGGVLPLGETMLVLYTKGGPSGTNTVLSGPRRMQLHAA